MISPIDSLPADIVGEVVSWLSVGDLRNCASTCRRLASAVEKIFDSWQKCAAGRWKNLLADGDEIYPTAAAAVIEQEVVAPTDCGCAEYTIRSVVAKIIPDSGVDYYCLKMGELLVRAVAYPRLAAVILDEIILSGKLQTRQHYYSLMNDVICYFDKDSVPAHIVEYMRCRFADENYKHLTLADCLLALNYGIHIPIRLIWTLESMADEYAHDFVLFAEAVFLPNIHAAVIPDQLRQHCGKIKFAGIRDIATRIHFSPDSIKYNDY